MFPVQLSDSIFGKKVSEFRSWLLRGEMKVFQVRDTGSLQLVEENAPLGEGESRAFLSDPIFEPAQYTVNMN